MKTPKMGVQSTESLTIMDALNQTYKSVRRKTWPVGHRICCDINTGNMYIHTSHSTFKWNPTEHDLTAQDWEVLSNGLW